MLSLNSITLSQNSEDVSFTIINPDNIDLNSSTLNRVTFNNILSVGPDNIISSDLSSLIKNIWTTPLSSYTINIGSGTVNVSDNVNITSSLFDVDSIMNINNEEVVGRRIYLANDTVGGVVPTTSFQEIDFNNIIFNDTGYTRNVGGSITIADTGFYEISYTINILDNLSTNQQPTRSTFVARVLVDSNPIINSESNAYLRSNANSSTNTSTSFVTEITSTNSVITIEFRSLNTAGQYFSTDPNLSGSCIYIKKI